MSDAATSPESCDSWLGHEFCARAEAHDGKHSYKPDAAIEHEANPPVNGGRYECAKCGATND